MNGVSKRKRQEIEISDTESTELDHVERLETREESTITSSELTGLFTAATGLWKSRLMGGALPCRKFNRAM
jgi:hypothetical protein